jgi:hypothetical protein
MRLAGFSLPQSSRELGSTQYGFTHVEAVLVLAGTLLIGALVVAAIRTYLVRAEIEESIALAKYAQDQVTRAFRRTGTPPADSASAGLVDNQVDVVARYVAETRVTDGRIDLVFGPEASAALKGRTLSLTPFETADRHVVWICGSKEPGVGLKPLGFAGGGPLAVQPPPTIDPHYLPRDCR